MWSPTHVQVTVCRAKGLLTKGKHGTNDAFVVIALGKEKFQTSVKQKAPSDLDWQEECELSIPNQGNTAEIILTVLHQNFIGVDEFLGTVSLPLANFDVYERPKNRWYTLHSKPGQESKTKYRGELEVRVAFTVKSGSLLDLSKKEKHKGSLGQISQAATSFTGSLMSLGSKEKKNIKKLASSVGHKLSKLPGRGSLRKEKREGGSRRGSESIGEPDPGVISEDEDEFRFDELSHKSSASSLNVSGSRNTSVSGSLENLAGGEFMRRNSMPRNSSSTLPRTPTISPLAIENPPKPARSLSKEEPVDEWDKKLFGKQGKLAESAGSVQSGVPSIIVQGSNPFNADDAVLPKITEESLGQFERRKPVTVSLTRRRDLGKDEALPDVFEEVEPVKEEPKTKIKGKEAAVVMPVPRDPSPAPRLSSKSSSHASDHTPNGVKEPSHVSGETMHSHLHAQATFPSPSHPSSEASSFPVLPLEHGEPSETPEEPSIDRLSESRITARSPVLSSASSPAANRRSTEEGSTVVSNEPAQASVPVEAPKTDPPFPAPRERKNDTPIEAKPVPLPRSSTTAKASEPAQTGATTQIQIKWDEMQESRVDDEEESEMNSGYVDLWSYQPQITPAVGGVIVASSESSSLEINNVQVKTEDQLTKQSDTAESESFHTPFSFAVDTETKLDVDTNAGVVELPWVEPDLQHEAVYEDDLASDALENREEEEKMAPIDRSSYYKIISESTINQSLLSSANISGSFSTITEEYSPIKQLDSPRAMASNQAMELEDEELVVSASVQGNVFNSSVIAGQVNRTVSDDHDVAKSLLLSNSEIDNFSKPNQPVINSSPKSLDYDSTKQTEFVSAGSQPVNHAKTKSQSSLEDVGSISNHLSPRSQSTEPLSSEGDRRSTQTSSGVLSGSLEPSTSNYESDNFQGSQGRKVVKADPNLLHLDSEISESDDYDDNLHKDRSPGSKEHRAALASFPQRVVEGKEMAEEEVPLKVTKKELSQYEGKSRDELVALICNLKSSAAHKDQQIVELKEYIGELLLRVMENAPGILQNPPSPVN